MINSDESDDDGEVLLTQNTRSSNVKVYEHVPPRIDAEKYQADIPPMVERRPVREGKSIYSILAIVQYC